MKCSRSPSRPEIDVANAGLEIPDRASDGQAATTSVPNDSGASAPPGMLSSSAVGQQMALNTLPADIHELIAGRLEPRDLCNFSSTARMLGKNTYSIRLETGVHSYLQRHIWSSRILSLDKIEACWTILLRLFPTAASDPMTVMEGPLLAEAVSRFKKSFPLMQQLPQLVNASVQGVNFGIKPDQTDINEFQTAIQHMKNVMTGFLLATQCFDDADMFYCLVILSWGHAEPNRAAIRNTYTQLGAPVLATLMARLETEMCGGKVSIHEIFPGWETWRPASTPTEPYPEKQWNSLRLQAIVSRAGLPQAVSDGSWNNPMMMERFFQTSANSDNEKALNASRLRLSLNTIMFEWNQFPDGGRMALTFILDHGDSLEKQDRSEIFYYASVFFKLRLSGAPGVDTLSGRLATACRKNDADNETRLGVLKKILARGIRARHSLNELIQFSRELPDELRARLWESFNHMHLDTGEAHEDRALLNLILDEFASFPEHLHAQLCGLAAKIYHGENDQYEYETNFELKEFWLPISTYLPENRQLALCKFSRILLEAPSDTRTDLTNWLCDRVDELPEDLRAAPLTAIMKIERSRLENRRVKQYRLIARSVAALPPASRATMMRAIDNYKQAWRDLGEKMWLSDTPYQGHPGF